jgi:hypothetical protein
MNIAALFHNLIPFTLAVICVSKVDDDGMRDDPYYVIAQPIVRITQLGFLQASYDLVELGTARILIWR